MSNINKEKVLNLSNSWTSDIGYQISQFPDGQQNIVIFHNFGKYKQIPIQDYRSEDQNYQINERIINLPNYKVTIKSHFNSFKDLELIICATKALRRLGVKEINLYIPYLLGARSDRQFQEGSNSYLVDVIAPIINAQKFESVTVLDVHSDVAAACINNLKVIDNTRLVRHGIIDLCKNEDLKGIVVVSPDAGAQKKIYNSIDGLGIVQDVICASKHRNHQ